MQNEAFRKLLASYPAKAIKLLYDKYYHTLIRFAHRYTGEKATAEDVVQETFALVWENHRQLGEHHDISFEYYLVKVVKYKAIAAFKRTQSQFDKNQTIFNNVSDITEHSIESRIIESERNHQLYWIINTFPRKERECLLLRLKEGLGPAEIADRLQVSRKAVERSLTSANKRLRKIYREIDM